MIEIRITGPTGSGKSTIAVALKKALADCGYECSIDEPRDVYDAYNKISFAKIKKHQNPGRQLVLIKSAFAEPTKLVVKKAKAPRPQGRF